MLTHFGDNNANTLSVAVAAQVCDDKTTAASGATVIAAVTDVAPTVTTANTDFAYNSLYLTITGKGFDRNLPEQNVVTFTSTPSTTSCPAVPVVWSASASWRCPIPDTAVAARRRRGAVSGARRLARARGVSAGRRPRAPDPGLRRRAGRL